MGAEEPGLAELVPGPAAVSFLPRMLPAWAAAEPVATHRVVDGSLVLFDITGFTPLTERLAHHGREGAEELSILLDAVFTRLLTEVEAEGADVLKWGGDAILLLLDGPEHHSRAARAALRMQQALARIGRVTISIGRVVLHASAGIESGLIDLVLAGNPAMHRDLVVLGPRATSVTRLEHSARSGEVLLGDGTVAHLSPDCVRPRAGGSHLLVSMPTAAKFPLELNVVPETTSVSQLLPPQVRTYLSQSSPEPEHRTVAVAFFCFDRSDAVLVDEGPEALTEAVDEVLRNVQDAATVHDLPFVDTDVDADGGKLMLVGGAPRSAGYDTDRVLSAVGTVVGRAGRLPLRAGVAHGRVFAGVTGSTRRRTYSVIGDAVNLAARLAAHTKTGSVLVAADVMAHARRYYMVQDAPPAVLKGKSKPIPVVALGKPLEMRQRQHPEDLLVGRDDELASLSWAIARLADGSGAVVEVIGEPGIGKSRLIEEGAARSHGVTVLRCECERTGAGTPYAPIRRLLRQMLGASSTTDPGIVARRLRDRLARDAPDLRPWLSLLAVVLDLRLHESPEVAALAEGRRSERVAELVAEVLGRSVQSPAILVVDDVHLADPASAGVLAAVARRTRTEPWLLLVSRDDRAVHWLPAEAVRINLGPLTMAAAIQLAQHATPDRPLPPAIAEALAIRSGGHPLLLVELVRAAARGEDPDDLPSSVEELAAVQIDRLPLAARSLLRLASVLGNEFDEHILRKTVGDLAPNRSAIEMLSTLDDLLVSTGDHLRFRHPILREVAYAGLPYRRRRELHAKAAEVLQTSSVASRSPEALAWHYFVAGDYDKAIEYGWRAGERAMARYAPAGAADAYRRAAQAARLSPTISASQRSIYLEALGDAELLAGRPAESAAAYLEALRGIRGEHVREADLALKLARVESRRGRFSNALRRTSLGLRALEQADGDKAGAMRARLQVRYAVCRLSQGRYADARRWADRALNEAEAAHEFGAEAQAHLVLHSTDLWSAAPNGRRHGETALRLFQVLGDLGGQAHALNNLAMSHIFEGRWSEALSMLRRAADLFRRVGDAANAANADYNQADVLVRQGRSYEAQRLLEETLRIARAVSDEELVALVRKEQGRAQSRAGDVRGGLLLLAEARAQLVKLGEPHEVVDADIATAEAQLLAGAPEQALTLIRTALAQATSLGAATLSPSAYRVLAAALFATGALSEAKTALDDGLRASSSPDVAHERGFLLTIAARIARRSEDPDADRLERAARAAIESLGVLRVPIPNLVE